MFQVALEILGYVTAKLLDIVHDVCLVHHVPLTERHEFLELIG